MRIGRLELLPLAVVTILVTTAVPVELGGDAGWRFTFDAGDVIQNLLLYLPLGIALRHRGIPQVVLVSAMLSLVIEVTQLWGVNRFASPVDVAANVLGAWGGALMWRRGLKSDGCRVTPAGLGFAIGIVAALLVAWSLPLRAADLQWWDTEYPLLIGNERMPTRPWLGRVDSLILLPYALAPGTIRSLRFPDRAGRESVSVDGVFRLPLPVVATGGPAVVLPDEAGRRFTRAARRHDGFTIAVGVTPSTTHQTGPARIVSLSLDTLHRNFDLGQEGSRLVLRVATPVSGANGNDYRAETPAVVSAGKELAIVATYDGSISRIFVDGSLRARSNLAASGCAIRVLCDWALPPAWALFAGSLALLALALGGARGGLSTALRLLPAAIVALAVPGLLQSGVVLRTSSAWTPLAALLGVAAVGLAWVPLDGRGSPSGAAPSDGRRVPEPTE